jgi:hypothetical protein
VVPRWLVWPIFALTMGFFIGGSVFWGLYGPNATIQEQHATAKEQPAQHSAAEEKEKADEALARYTFWLTLFTGVLAIATVGLGVATAGLYLTGEKQIKVTRRSNQRQLRKMQASIATAEDANKLNREVFAASQRPWLDVRVLLASGFETNGESALVQLQVIIKNVSDIPALNVTCDTSTFPNAESENERGCYRQLSERMKARNFKNSGYGITLFPEREMEASRSWTAATWFAQNVKPKVQNGGIPPLGALGVCVCVDYASAVSDRHYQTGFIYVILAKNTDINDAWISFGLEKSIPQSDLRLVLHPLGSHTI